MNLANTVHKLFCGEGFDYGPALSKFEISTVREFICESIEIVNNHNLKIEEIESYHLYGISSEKHLALTKEIRIFNKSQLKTIRSFKIFEWLEDLFGNTEITNEELKKNEEVYWRIVRPNCKNDVGPVHADAWFWQSGIGIIPKDKVRIKIWIQIAGTEPGLIFYPNTHHLEFNYATNLESGKNKPVFDINSYRYLNKQYVTEEIGVPFIFNDRLLHGGSVSKRDSRSSIEFTILVDRSLILNTISNYF